MNSLFSIKDLVGKIKNNSLVAMSGFSYMNPPMAIIREIINKDVKNLRIVTGPTSGIETDILIGAGCVSEVISAGVSFEKISGVAPNFKNFVEKDKVRVWECDECIWHTALDAAILGKKHLLWPGGVGTSIPKLNQDLEEVKVDGKWFIKVPAIKPDVGIVHVGVSDRLGNIGFPDNLFLKRQFCEEKIAKVSDLVVASCEHTVESVENPIAKDVFISESEFGCHPGASNGYYIPDLEHYKEYVWFVKENKFEDYLNKYVFDKSHEDYVDIVGEDKLKRLVLSSGPIKK